MLLSRTAKKTVQMSRVVMIYLPLTDLPGEYSGIAGSYLFDSADHVIGAHERLSAAVRRRIK